MCWANLDAFFIIYFLLFELCHITISLQEWINNSSWPPRCVTPPPTAPVTGFWWKGWRKEVLACFCSVGFEKPACLKPVGICDIQYTTEMRILECVWGKCKQPLWPSKPASISVPNYAAMKVRTKWLQSHQKQLSFAASKAGRGQVNIGEEKQPGHFFLCEGPGAVGGADGMKCFCFRLENAKEWLHKLFCVLEEEWIDLKDRWCLWNMQIELSWSKQLPFHCLELQTERNDSQETKDLLKGRRWRRKTASRGEWRQHGKEYSWPPTNSCSWGEKPRTATKPPPTYSKTMPTQNCKTSWKAGVILGSRQTQQWDSHGFVDVKTIDLISNILEVTCYFYIPSNKIAENKCSMIISFKVLDKALKEKIRQDYEKTCRQQGWKRN